MAVGLVVSVWLFANSVAWTGPIATAYPQVGDITFIVGFVITAALYYVFNLDMASGWPIRGQPSALARSEARPITGAAAAGGNAPQSR